MTDGHALSGAKVTLGSASTLSDSSGNYSFANVAAGAYTLTGSASGFLTRSYSVNIIAGTTLTQNIQLSVAGVLAGVVTNSSGSGIGGALIQYSGGVLNQTSTISADTTGHFKTGWIPVGTYTLSVSASGYQTGTVSATVNTGQTTSVTVQLAFSSTGGTGPGAVTGKVTSVTDGTVIAGATLTLGSATTISDSTGNYTFSSVAAGSYALTAKASGFLSRSYTVSVTAGATTVQNVQLSVAGILQGKVSSSSGSIAGATVQYSGGSLNQTASILTDANGNYNTGWIPIGSYSLTVSASGFATNTASATVNTGQTTTANVLLAASSGGGTGLGSVSGTVSSIQDGHAIAGAQLSLGSAVTTSDSTGHYTFSNVASATYILNAAASGFLSRSYTVTVSGNAVTQNVQLSVAGVLQGTVTNSSGSTVAGAAVQLVGGALSQTFNLTTNTSGVYNSGWIPIGSYTVTASASGVTGTATATVNSGQTTTANVTLGTGGGGGTITCTPPSNGAIVCNPANGATLTSPIHFVAAANSPNGMGDIWTYIDSTNVAQAHNVTNVDYPSLSVPTGTHTVRIQAWDKVGNLFKAGVTLTITTGSTSTSLISPKRAVVTFATTQQFTSNTAVNWSVDGVAGGNSTVGTISSSGVYAPPQAVGQHTVTAASQADPSQTASATIWVSNSGPILTHKYNNYRTGQNTSETVLTPSNVNSSTFGKLLSYPVDGFNYAEPLYVPNLSIAGGTHNVVFVSTEHDSVYAFDADGKQSAPLWKVSFLSSGVTTFPQPSSSEIGPEIGITSTPAMDLSSGTMYVVANTQVNGSGARYQLHALDIHTGTEKFGGPVTITGSVSGTGAESSGGVVTFDPVRHLQRPGLLLANGAIYIGFGSYGDIDPYHGWVFAYSASTLARLGVFCATPNGGEGAFWQAGGGLAADSGGNVYGATSNGTFSVQNGGRDYGDTIVNFGSSTGLNVSDWFSPYNNSFLDTSDLDLGSGGPLLLPDGVGGTNLLVIGGKNGAIYVLNRGSLGHWQSSSDSQIVQSIQNASLGQFMGTPAFWNSWVYFGALNDHVRAYQLQNGKLTTSPTSLTTAIFNKGQGPQSVVSANASSNGILWTIEPTGSTSEVLHAFDATDLSRELYNSTQAGSRDDPGSGNKFTAATVANGKVFVGTKQSLVVYGLLPQ